MVVDADTGFGNALNVRHSVRVLERAGADAIQIEDQTTPKKCGHFEDKSIISTEEMAGKIKAAVADVTFVEAPRSADEIRHIPERLPVPQVINVVVGGETPVFSQEDLAKMRYGLVLYANVALQGAIAGMQAALKHLKQTGRLAEADGLVARFEERQRLVRKPAFDALEKKYSERT